MGWRGTLVLGIALLAAALYLYRDIDTQHPDASWRVLFETPRPSPPGAQIKRLFAFDPATVTALRVRRQGRQWTLRRTASGWQGAERAADVDDFLESMQDLAEVMPLDVAPDELDDHGLDPPEGVIEVERAGAPPLVLLVGRRNPPATGVYVQLGPGGAVVLTGALLLWELDKATRALTPAS